jgi:hypothetical protein
MRSATTIEKTRRNCVAAEANSKTSRTCDAAELGQGATEHGGKAVARDGELGWGRWRRSPVVGERTNGVPRQGQHEDEALQETHALEQTKRARGSDR